jgi:hypothetical protein
MLSDALDYAAKGWSIFPVPPNTKKSYKSEKHSGGRKWGATIDVAEIHADFTRWPDAGIGVVTGAISQIAVIETDTPKGHGVDGAGALAELETKYGRLPDTLMAISPSGSIHRYFKHPGGKVKSSASELGPGIDVRGDGGMVIAPPTVRADGVYRWLNNNPVAPMPEWLVQLTQEPPPRRPTIRERATAAVNAHRIARLVQNGGGSAYANAALRSEIADLANSNAGVRNAALNKATFSLAQLVHAGLLIAADVERHLVDACTANGLIADDGPASVMATIKSAFKGASLKPRRGLA